MRIWNGYGSEHSMNLILIGQFQTVAEARAVTERMKALEALAEAEWSDDDWRSRDERMPPEISKALYDMQLYDMGRSDVDAYALDHRVTRDGEKIRIWTDDTEIQGFLKVLLHHGAKVEIFSRHNWDGDANPIASEEDANPAAPSDTSDGDDGGSD
ncbi:hypothetical protein GPZ77_02500 [Streptomyces sp. QHH-9511]|uniref:DUF6375 family protein n=1 Tax=Streptomyces sp. QHH-9511 TaxID=2684468 RepID=UPI0013170F48|nr:DUF6375 family protein [Streptomyces sp. QHH-9511]QGZ47422.1 hypothetical protein GPZ77_02500 [Streptomyces sp. QHH-9511]